MNKTNLLYLSILLLGPTYSAIIAMSPTRKPILAIKNEAHKKISVICKYNGKPLCIALEHGQTDVLDNFSALQAIAVYPSGKIRGLLTMPNIPVKWFKKDLLKTHETLKIAHLNGQSTQLTVCSQWTPLNILMCEENAAEVNPYNFKVTLIKPVVTVLKRAKSESLDLLDYFPQVKKAVMNNKRVHPRYFLNVPEGSSEEAVDHAHERLRQYWQAHKDNSDSDFALLAGEILEILQAACMSICTPKLPNNYELLVAQYQPVKEDTYIEPLTQEQEDTIQCVSDVFASVNDDSE